MKKAAVILFSLAAVAYGAGEISVNWAFTAAKGALSITRTQSKTWNITNSAPNVSAYTITTTTNPTPILPGYVSTNGWGWLLNTSSNIAVQVGALDGSTFCPVIQLGPGEGHPMHSAPGVTNYARATTNSAVLECPIIDN